MHCCAEGLALSAFHSQGILVNNTKICTNENFPLYGISGNKLSLDNLGQVMEEVLDVSAQWYHLGLQLKVGTGTLDSIQTQFTDPKRQLLEMLKTWLTTNTSTSWKTLTDALRSRSVGASQLAGVLETKYCLVEGTEVDNGTSDSQPETNITPFLVSEQRAFTQPPSMVQACKSYK